MSDDFPNDGGDAAPQNIYDDAEFFAGYARLRATKTGLNEALEQPALWSLLPKNLAGLRVLDLGCGFGDFARTARKAGARSVLGVDVSAKMLARARELTHDPAIRYVHSSIEGLRPEGLHPEELGSGGLRDDEHRGVRCPSAAADSDASRSDAADPCAPPFDLAVSSLALHYVADYRGAAARIAALLAPGGLFVLSVEHPMCTALASQKWIRDDDGRALGWPVDQYREEGPRRTRWFVDGVIKYHRTVETYVNGLLDAGLILRRLLEPEPVDGPAARSVPNLELHRRRPPFLLLAAQKPEN